MKDTHCRTFKPHELTGMSEFGSGEPNEFATWLMGREHFLSDRAVSRSPPHLFELPF